MTIIQEALQKLNEKIDDVKLDRDINPKDQEVISAEEERFAEDIYNVLENLIRREEFNNYSEQVKKKTSNSKR